METAAPELVQKIKRSWLGVETLFDQAMQADYHQDMPYFQVTKNIRSFDYDNVCYWKAHDDPAWKQACRTAPPVPRNGAPVRVLFDHQRMATYRFDFAFVYA